MSNLTKCVLGLFACFVWLVVVLLFGLVFGVFFRKELNKNEKCLIKTIHGLILIPWKTIETFILIE